MLYGIRRLLLLVWRGWFYLLAALPVLYLFPFLVVALLLPNGYRAVFWMARNIWAPWVLLGMGFWPVVKQHPLADTRQAYLLIAKPRQLYRPVFDAPCVEKTLRFCRKKRTGGHSPVWLPL